ncbi:hypothetical protein P4S64_03750 [Vibrio sp. M60_M31a]
MPYHFKEAPSNQLTNTAQDPVTKMPELKACAVEVELLPVGHKPLAPWEKPEKENDKDLPVRFFR